MSGPRNLRAHLETHRQMQPLQVCTVSNRKLEDADENAQWEKAKLMQPMRLYVSSDRSTFSWLIKSINAQQNIREKCWEKIPSEYEYEYYSV